MKRRTRILKRSILSWILSLCMIISPLANTGLVVAAAEAETLYSQDFTDVADAATVATAGESSYMTIANDTEHGNYLSYDFTGSTKNSRGLDMTFTGLDVTTSDAYVVEFDASIKPGNGQATQLAVRDKEFTYGLDGYSKQSVNCGVETGYLLKLVNGGASSTEYTVNGGRTVTIPSGEWCHYKMYVDKTLGLVSVTITDSTGAVVTNADKLIVEYDGGGNVAGLYMLAGRYQAVELLDNVEVRTVTVDDVFGTVEEMTVSFDMNGYGEEVSSQTVLKYGHVTAPTEPAETGYVFCGWYTDAACTTAWDFATNIVSADMTLYAKWVEEEKMTVSFEMNGHGDAITAQEILKDGLVTKPTNPLADGFVFRGWYKEAECTTAWDFAADTVSENTTLYAKWTEDAAFDTAGALYAQGFSGISDVNTIATSTNAQSQLMLQTDDDHGYYLAFDFSSYSDNTRGAITTFGGLDVTAKDTYIVEFDAAITPGNGQVTAFTVAGKDLKYGSSNMNNGATEGFLVKLENAGSSGTDYTVNGSTETVTIPSGEWCHYKLYVDKTQKKVSLTITGTSTENIADEMIVAYDGEGNVSGLYMLAGRYYSVYKVDNIKVYEPAIEGAKIVSFDLQGHGDAIDDVQVEAGGTLKAPIAPAADGYTFGGWYTDAACTTAWDFATGTVSEDMTLYAKWITRVDPSNALHVERFDNVTDIKTMITSGLESAVTLANDTAHGNYFSFDIGSVRPSGGRGTRLDIGVDLSKQTKYILEFDAALKVTDNAGSALAVMGTDFKYVSNNINYGAGSNYLINLYSDAANDTGYNLNGTGEITIPSEEWCHYTLYVDTTLGLVSVTIDGAGENIISKKIVPMNGAGKFAGFYVMCGRYNGAAMIDNIVVRTITDADDFGVLEYKKLSFNMNGHGDAIADVDVIKDCTATAPTDPLATGYVFRGWYTDAACTTAWDFATGKVSVDMTLYAKWTADTAESGSDYLYYQSFSGLTDISTVVTSKNAQGGVVLSTDDTNGYFLTYSISGQSGNRGAEMAFTGLDVSKKEKYIVEFDASIDPGETNTSQFVIKGADFAYDTDMNTGAKSGYLLKLVNAAGDSTVYTINDTEDTVTIPSGEWCHYKLYVDETLNKVSLTIIDADSKAVVEKKVLKINGSGNAAGLYMLIGRATGAYQLDNVKVRELTATDEIEIKSGTEYFITKDVTGNTTTVDPAELVISSNITGYQITTSKGGKVVSQTVVEEVPESIDTTGADKLEIAPVFYFELGTPGLLGEGGADLPIPADTYDFVVYNTSGNRTDVYVNDQMLVNNLLQNGSTPNYYAVNNIVVTGDTVKISTADCTTVNIKVQVVKSPTIVTRAQKVFVLGDSLVAVYYNGASATNNIRTGWGQVLENYLADGLDVVDLANSGVTAPGLYATAFSQVKGSAKAGDILILESGYNDKSYCTEDEMKDAVSNMVIEAEALGVEVILVSPNASAHDYKESVAWTSYMKDVAELEEVTYINLSKLSYDFLVGIYGTDTETVYANYNLVGDGDSLHSSFNGANKWASLVAGSLYDQGYTDLVDEDYIYTFIDSVGNVISCSATGKKLEGYAKVTYDLNDYGTNSYLLVAQGSTLTQPKNPLAAGYAFGGWYKDEALTEAWNFETDTVTVDTVLYAKWTEDASAPWYVQDFTGVTDASKVATSPNAQNAMFIQSDDVREEFLIFDRSSITANGSRGGYINFADLDVRAESKYIVEFDAAITPGDNQRTYLAVKGTNFTYSGGNVDYGTGTDYIMNLVNTAAGKDTYTLNTYKNVTIPSGVWCSYKLYVDKTQGFVSITITNIVTGEVIADKVIAAIDGGGNVAGIYLLAGRYNAIEKVDNIVVRGVGEDDEFGVVSAEVLASAEFTAQLNTVITQPAEDSPVHKVITVKGNGDLGGDLSDKVTVKWSVVGLDGDDGYVSLTKEIGTGAGTDGVAPDGTTAYFNVRNGVSNYFGYVQAVVSYGDKSYTIKTPFAVTGGSSADANQLAPAAGYYINMNNYPDSLVGYKGTSDGLTTRDIVLNNWSIYGSNGARSMTLVQDTDGTKSLKFDNNGGGGSTVAVYQWADQTSQYVIDFTAKFTAKMDFGVYFNTPNNGTNNPEWYAHYDNSTLTLNGSEESITGIALNTWYRFVVTADASVQKASITVYDKDGNKVGAISGIDMLNNASTQKYFCFYGTWPMYLNSFEAYKPVLSTMTVSSNVETIEVPDVGEAAAKVNFTAALAAADGLTMTGAVAWSLAEEYANVEIASTGAQTATLTINPGASGTVTVLATKDGKQVEKTIQLTTSTNVVAFKKSTASLTVPFNGEKAVVSNFVAVTRSGSGEEIQGGTITYALLASDGVTETTVKGVTFANGVLTVEAGADPAVVYVKATNADGLTTKVKVDIHNYSFVFGSADAAEGYTQVANTLYTASRGYGFANTDGLTVNANTVTATAAYRFKANIPNGNYTVKVTTSAGAVTSEVVESVPAATGITKSGKSFSVAVCDGVLDLTFPANETVTSIEISKGVEKTERDLPYVYAIGDSTTKNNASGALSWGNCVANSLVIVPSAFDRFENHGKAGDDSVVYYNSGRVEAVLLSIHPGDYVTVNMGINSKESGEAASYYTLLSEYYVEGIIQRGGIPVIVTATPDGPVGDRVSSNYDSVTGKFTNNRGDGARNNVLRQIAQEKGLDIIELGQWGQDWMNTLTMDDVTAYNKQYSTAFTTVLEMVQSWYVDHNHYKEYLGIRIGNYIFDCLEAIANKETVIYDFQNETNASWGMTGSLSANVSIVDDSAVAGNKYLQITGNEVGNTTTTKTFADMPKMTEATVDFKWYFGGMTSTNRAGGAGIALMAGEQQLISLYTSDMRASGDESSLYYTTSDFASKVDSGVKVANGSWHNISVAFDFEADSAVLYVDGAKAATVTIPEIAQKFDGLAFVTYEPGSTKVTTTMGIDDVEITYVEKIADDDVVTIYSIGAIENITVTAEQWAAGYQHPTSVTATLTNGETITVQIDASTWTCENFNASLKGAYTWTADIIAPAEYANPRGRQATYVMEYHAPVANNHDYWNDFTFSSELIDSVAWGKGMDSTSGSGGFSLSHATDAGNGYLSANVTGNGDRGSRLDLTTDVIKGSKFSFDWMPINNNGSAHGDLMFVSTASWHPYFTIRFDKNYNITAFTKNPLGGCSTTQKEFEGSIAASDPIDTGLGGQNKWFSVTLEFDYLAHTADFTITEKANPENTFTLNDIPIEKEANGVRAMVMHMAKLASGASVTMGLDNIAVDYVRFGANDVVKVKNPATISISKIEFDAYEFPKTVVATLGDGNTVELPVTEWTATPAFDKNVSGDYLWTADLVLGDYTNYFGLNTSFTMTYTMYPYPTFVFNPPTLELKYGETFDVTAMPTSVTAKMGNGTISTIEVGEWTAIREFNGEEEGIYVYGANVKQTEGVNEILRDKLTPNENPDDPSAQREDYVYDVYYRISYFESEDNYNAYTRSMEYLDRGVYAVETEDGVFVSWRLLVSEYGEDIAFNVYRNGVLVNDTPINSKTNLVDVNGKAGDVYVVGKIKDGLFYGSDEVVASAQNYMSIPVQKPVGLKDKDGNVCTYTMNDAGTADVDGDGQYEIIVKWYPNDAFDSGSAGGPSGPTLFDVYEMDGTPLWRLNLGLELPSGAHFNQFMLYDLDEDGKAELFVKTSDGSVTYKPNAEGKFDMSDESTIVSYIGNENVIPGTNVTANGHVAPTTNEYVTVFNGQTGEEIDTIDYVNKTGEFTDWGYAGGGKNDGGNRSARYNIAIGYLPVDQDDMNCTTTIPAVLFNRGYYDKTTVAAYTLRDGKLTLEWNYVTENATECAGKGNHNMATGDVDKDGFDELVIGAMALDHDGSVLWVKNGKDGQDYAGHADAIHLAAMNPNNNDLYVFTPQEHTDATFNESLSNAGTGVRYIANWHTKKDVGRGVAANITPNPGYEFWSASTGSGLYGFDGSVISQSKNLAMNWILYWDGDLLSELGNGASTEGNMQITKYNWETDASDILETFEGTKMCNWTKNTPSLTADLFGDWREEVVVRNDDDTELRIYMTTIETDYMIYTLMHDPVYRNSVANQNTSYNQPSHVGIYLGEDQRDVVLNKGLDTAEVVYTVDVNEEGTEIPPSVTPEPTPGPTVEPTPEPTTEPTPGPTQAPVEDEDDEDDEDEEPVPTATPAPTQKPEPTKAPATTQKPVEPTAKPGEPTAKPGEPTAKPGEPTQKPAEPTAKPTDPTKPAKPVIKVEHGKKDEVPGSVMTDEVKAVTGCNSVEELISYMKENLVKYITELRNTAGNGGNAGGSNNGKGEAPEFTVEKTAVYEITVMVNNVPATKENFPKEGVDVIIPYPEGTNKNDFDFSVGHVPTNDWNGAKPGVMEYLEVIKTDEGLKVHVMSASPFVVAWTASQIVIQPTPVVDVVESDGNMMIWVVIGILAVALIGVGVVTVVLRKKKDEQYN